MSRRRPRGSWLALGVLTALAVATAAQARARTAPRHDPAEPPAAPAATTEAVPAAPPVAAPTPAPTPAAAAGDDADAFVARATRHFKDRDYAGAAAALTSAYALDPRPLFLFNIGQAYRLGDRPKDAAASYEQFLRVAPQHALAPEAKGYLQAMRSLIAEREKATAVERALENERQLVAAAQEAARQEQERAHQAELRLQEERRRTTPPLYRRGWFWGVLGGIAAAAVVAGAVGGYYANQPPSTDGGFRDFRF